MVGLAVGLQIDTDLPFLYQCTVYLVVRLQQRNAPYPSLTTVQVQLEVLALDFVRSSHVPR